MLVKTWKFLAILAVFILLVVACATPAEQPTEAPTEAPEAPTAEPMPDTGRPAGVPAEGESPSLDAIYAAGVVRAGFAPTKPISFVDPDSGAFVGIGPDLAAEIADRLGVELEQVGAEWDGVVQGLPAGKYDIIMTGLAYRPERAELVDYVFMGELGACVLARADDDRITSFEDLQENADLKLGLITGISFEDMVRSDYPEITLVSMPNPGVTLLWEDVLSGRIDATMGDAIGMPPYLALAEGQLKVVPEDCLEHPLFGYQWGHAFAKGDMAFQTWFDDQVQELKDSGWYQDRWEYWVNETLSPEATEDTADTGRPTGVPAEGESPSLDAIYAAGVVRAGFAPTKPISFVDPDSGAFVGIGPDLAAEIADRLGVELEQVGAEWDGVVQGLPAGKYDIIMTGLAYRPERAELVDYVFMGELGACVLARADDDRITSFEDLQENADLKLGLITGISFEDMVRSDYPEITLVSMPNPGVTLLWEDVLSGRIDATMGDAIGMPPYLALAEGQLKVVPEDCLEHPLFGYQWGHTFAKGDMAFQTWFDDQVQELKDSGWYQDRWEYWVNETLSPEATE